MFSPIQHDDLLERVFAQAIAVSQEPSIRCRLRSGEVCEVGEWKLALKHGGPAAALLEAIEVVPVNE